MPKFAKKVHDQSGVGLTIIFVIVAILIAVVGTAYMGYSHNHKAAAKSIVGD